MTLNLSKIESKRLEQCKKTRLEILNGRKAPPASQAYWHWCSANKRPHLLIKHRRKFSYVSMDLPNVPCGAGAYPEYLELFYSLCRKYKVVPAGYFSVLDVPKRNSTNFASELLEIGFTLYGEHIEQYARI